MSLLFFENVTVKAVTAKAVLFLFEIGDPSIFAVKPERWVPLSVIDLEETDVEFEKGATGTVAIAEWFCEKEGFEP